jgi:hypothetical protein
MDYTELYNTKQIRVNFFHVNNDGKRFERIVTGAITNEDINHLVIYTVKQEVAVILKINIIHVLEVVKK